MKLQKIKIEYAPMPGSHIKKTEADRIGRELARIHEKHSALEPSSVVDEARNPKSPLHSQFTWDDTKAAEKCRLQEARILLGGVRIITIDHGKEGPAVRAFVSMGKIGKRTYHPIQVVMAHETSREELLARAQQELSDWRARYAALKEFSDLFAVIDKKKLAA